MSSFSYGTSVQPASGFVGSKSYGLGFGSNGKYDLNGHTRWNDYDAVRRRLVSSVGTISYRCPKGHLMVVNADCAEWGDESSLYSPTANEINNCLNRIVGKIKAHNFNASGTFEAPVKTVNMVVDNMRKLGRAVQCVRHGDLSGTLAQLGASRGSEYRSFRAQDIPSRWLEVSYGWIPLLSDVYEGVKAFDARRNKRMATRFRAGIKRSGRTLHGNGVSNVNYDTIREYGRSYTCELKADPDQIRLNGFKDPLSLVWNILPWTFVVDWFLPIGSYLQAINQIPNLDARWLINDYSVCEGATNYRYLGPYPFCDIHTSTQCTSVASWPSHSYYGMRVKRTASLIPLPQVLPNFEGIRDAASPKRFANSLALLAQRFYNDTKPRRRAI